MSTPPSPDVHVVGAGPAGLMAAEQAASKGARVHLYDGMPSVGRKFLLAGIGGLNLTHSEAPERFDARYGARRVELARLLARFDATAVRAWARGLGVETFVGSSGRVFPHGMKASPLLRAWLARLHGLGVALHTRHRWQGWDASGALCFDTPGGARRIRAPVCVLALGGGSWARLGSNGAWVERLRAHGVPVAPLRPANCGFDTGWSAHFSARFAGHAVKPVIARWVAGGSDSRAGETETESEGVKGELMVSRTGIEGGPVYALSSRLRDSIERQGVALLRLDLAPGRSRERLCEALARPRGRRSRSEYLRRRVGLAGVKAGLLREVLSADSFAEPDLLAGAIKNLPLRLLAPRPIDEAISSAGGVPFEALDAGLMLRALPGVYCAGEMLDWEAPTGGYLLTACLASGWVAGRAAAEAPGAG